MKYISIRRITSSAEIMSMHRGRNRFENLGHDRIYAELIRAVLFIPIAERNRSRFPASAVVAASERPDCMDELVVRIRSEVRELAPACYNNAWAVLWHAGLHLDSRRQMH